jgi:hypothetical protein
MEETVDVLPAPLADWKISDPSFEPERLTYAQLDVGVAEIRDQADAALIEKYDAASAELEKVQLVLENGKKRQKELEDFFRANSEISDDLFVEYYETCRDVATNFGLEIAAIYNRACVAVVMIDSWKKTVARA